MGYLHYPVEFKEDLYATFLAEGNMPIVLTKIFEKYPQYKDRLDAHRAYAVCKRIRKEKKDNKLKTPEFQSGKTIPWKDLPIDQQELIINDATKARSEKPPTRWSAIAKDLAAKYPHVEMLMPNNLALVVGKKTGDIPVMKRPYRKRAAMQIGKQFTLQISNEGHFEIKAQINSETAQRIISEVLNG